MIGHLPNRIASIIKRDDIRGKYPDPLDEQVAFEIGRAFVSKILAQQGANRPDSPQVAVGHDSRQSGPALSHAMIAGLCEAGATVHALGYASTEMLYFAVGSTPETDENRPMMDGGIMITASHNPGDQNGFKMVKRNAQLLAQDDLIQIGQEVDRQLGRSKQTPWKLPPMPDCQTMEVRPQYASKVIELSGLDKLQNAGSALKEKDAKLRVVVESGHGMGGYAFRAVDERWPFLEVIYSHDRPDGAFPAGLPNPINPAYMQLVQDRVLAEQAELGLAFDGDGDRVGIVDEQGWALTPSEIMALLVDQFLDQFLDQNVAEKQIMYNLTCSRLVLDRVRQRGAQPLMTPVGHGQIKPLLRSHPECVFAGEHSGHYFFPEFFHADSGTIAGLMIVARVMAGKAGKAGKARSIRLHDIVAEWRKTYFSSPETNFDFRRSGGKLSEADQDRLKTERTERVRTYAANLGKQAAASRPIECYDVSLVEGNPIETSIVKWEFTESDASGPLFDWWFCIRPSGNEPLLRLNVEVILRESGITTGLDGRKVLTEKFDALVNQIGREFLDT